MRKPTLASVFSFGWGQTLALLVTCQHITGTGLSTYNWYLNTGTRLQHQYHYQTGRGGLVECLVRKPTLASVFSIGWGQTLACLWPVNILLVLVLE